MNQVKLNSLIREKKIVIPLYVLRMYKDFNLTSDEEILLIYLYDQDKVVFDPNKICEDLHFDLMNLMMTISSLSDKKILSLNTIKDEKGVMQEVIDLTDLYEKITIKVVEGLNTKDEIKENVHEMIEKEFNRILSPMEHEMIDEWQESNSFELIKEAVKEASLNGVTNLRYIDKILYDWGKQGIKKPSDIKKEIEHEEVGTIYNCDWLNDEDEEI